MSKDPSKKPRTRRLAVLLTEAERAEAQRLAEAHGVSIAAVLRGALHPDAPARTLPLFTRGDTCAPSVERS